MSVINNVRLIGRITRDLEVKTTANDKMNGRTALAVDKSYQGADGQWVNQAMFVELVVWGEKSVGYSKDKLKKGTFVAIEGELDVNNYTAQDGTKKTFTSVRVTSSRVLERRNNNGGKMNNNNMQSNNDAQAYNASQEFVNQSYDPTDFCPVDDNSDIPF